MSSKQAKPRGAKSKRPAKAAPTKRAATKKPAPRKRATKSPAERSPVTVYARAVVAGRVPACKWHKLACKRHLEDLRKGGRRGLRFDAGAADHALDFFGFLKHSKGEWAGQTFELEPLQKFIVGSIFGWKRRDGTRRFRVAYTEEPRKNGKSTLTAGIGLYLFVGDGEPGAEIYSAATKRDQAKIIHGEAKRMVQSSPGLKDLITVFTNNLSIEATNSKYEPLGADEDTLDGLNPHAALIDELHAHKTRQVWDVLNTATSARRQPLIFAITTAGQEEHSVCRDQHDYACQVLEGAIPDDSFFGLICTIDEGDDWTDPAVWAKANPNLGVSVKREDLERKCNEAIHSPNAQNAFRRLHLCEWTKQEARWLDLKAWDRCAGPVEIEDLAGRECFAGLDLSATTDISAFVMLFPPDEPEGVYRVQPHFWLPGADLRQRSIHDRVPYEVWVQDGLIEITEGEVIHYAAIRERIEQLGAIYPIREIAFDEWGARQLAQELDGAGFTVAPFRQGLKSMSGPTKELLNLVLSRRIAHGGNPVLRWMADCLEVWQDTSANVRPVKPKRDESGKRIDGIVALIMALARAQLNEGTGTSVYDKRGLVAL